MCYSLCCTSAESCICVREQLVCWSVVPSSGWNWYSRQMILSILYFPIHIINSVLHSPHSACNVRVNTVRNWFLSVESLNVFSDAPLSPSLCVFLLQNFKLLRDKTGQTRIGDLSPLDMKKVMICGCFTSLFVPVCSLCETNWPVRDELLS